MQTFCANRSNRSGDVAIFRFFSKWRLSTVLNFQKFEILMAGRPVRRAHMPHPAKFRADRSNHCRDIVIFQFFKMAAGLSPSWICFTRVWTTKSIRWSFWLCKIWLESMQFCSILYSRPWFEGWPDHGRTFPIYPFVILIDSSTGNPVHVLILSIQAVRGLPHLREPGHQNWNA